MVPITLKNKSKGICCFLLVLNMNSLKMLYLLKFPAIDVNKDVKTFTFT